MKAWQRWIVRVCGVQVEVDKAALELARSVGQVEGAAAPCRVMQRHDPYWVVDAPDGARVTCRICDALYTVRKGRGTSGQEECD